MRRLMPLSWLEQLTVCAAKTTRLIAGVMSGTSMDSIDVALCRIAGGGQDAAVDLLWFHQEPYAPPLAARLRNPAVLTVRDVSELHVLLGNAFADTCLHAFAGARVSMDEVDLIGSHGQTIYHHSAGHGAIKSTLQLGDADIIAARTGIGVLSDFRARDIAAGGEGAPLTPYTDVCLYQLNRFPHRAVLNLGGIANITFLERSPSQKLIGFDTGPANAPLDRLARLLSSGRQCCDLNGAYARAGHVDDEMLHFLLQDDYLLSPPPKSTGFERYGDEFINTILARFGPVSSDMIATLTEFVARTISHALRLHVLPCADISEIVIAGGGSRNPEMKRRLEAAVAPIMLVDSDALGVPSQAREAMAFALLANDALLGLPASLPSVTGARRASVLGKLSFPA
jgi:anhydro-N-acetylmuramic acid kinase